MVFGSGWRIMTTLLHGNAMAKTKTRKATGIGVSSHNLSGYRGNAYCGLGNAMAKTKTRKATGIGVSLDAKRSLSCSFASILLETTDTEGTCGCSIARAPLRCRLYPCFYCESEDDSWFETRGRISDCESEDSGFESRAGFHVT